MRYVVLSLSLSTVFDTLTVSVSRPRLLSSATNKRIKTAAPTTHTHGEVYHSPVPLSVEILTLVLFVVDVVELSLLPPLPCSCAQSARLKRLSTKTKRNGFQEKN